MQPFLGYVCYVNVKLCQNTLCSYFSPFSFYRFAPLFHSDGMLYIHFHHSTLCNSSNMRCLIAKIGCASSTTGAGA